MGRHLHKAMEYAGEAVEQSDTQEYIGLCYYSGSHEGLGRPTSREYAELNHATISIASLLCRQRINMLRAVHLLGEQQACRAAGDEVGAQQKQEHYLDLIREDIALQEEFEALLIGLHAQRPCFTRVGITQREIEDCILKTRRKIEKLKDYLEAVG